MEISELHFSGDGGARELAEGHEQPLCARRSYRARFVFLGAGRTGKG